MNRPPVSVRALALALVSEGGLEAKLAFRAVIKEANRPAPVRLIWSRWPRCWRKVAKGCPGRLRPTRWAGCASSW